VRRLIHAIEDLGELDNTLVVYIARDNGGTAIGGLNGTFNEWSNLNDAPEDIPCLLGAAEGIRVLFGRTLPGNLAMQGLAQKAGFKCAPDLEEPDTMRLQKRVDSPRATSAEP
jgi:arylsulfatase A-like enzyme